MMNKVTVIGGGLAGMEASVQLAKEGCQVTLIEKDGQVGGRVKQWDRLFPNKRSADEVIIFLTRELSSTKTRVLTNTEVKSVEKTGQAFLLHLNNLENITADAILLTTGYDLFNARVKEEYGYGIYDNVITSVDLEERFKNGNELLTAGGLIPKRVGFAHCVGSRDEKVGNTYCSQVCCVTAVKQAIEVKEKLPRAEVFCFYMDLRMFGLHFEELYKEAQEKWGINFIRGRVSEASENMDGSILVKVEDTLAGRPLKMKVDLFVLMVGFVPSSGTREIGQMLNLEFTPEGFLNPVDEHLQSNFTRVPGIFMAGTCKSPKTITDTLADARAAAIITVDYLRQKAG
jgi:heterodisulfide reductase subunit A